MGKLLAQVLSCRNPPAQKREKCKGGKLYYSFNLFSRWAERMRSKKKRSKTFLKAKES